MARHFQEYHNNNESLLRAEGIEYIKAATRGGDRLKRLLQRESFWIHTLDAMNFPGVNEEIDFRPFLWLLPQSYI